MNTKLSIIIVSILALAFWRVIPHPANVTPVMATALFCGAYLNDKKMALLLPLLAMLLADLFIGFHSTMLFVYAGIALTVGVGMYALQGKKDVITVGISSVACSLAFFFITNFGVWLMSESFYAKNLSGLVSAFVAGIPFYKNSLFGDLFFTALLFGSYYLLTNYKSKSRFA